jgi:outer membrane protein TolC
VIFGVVFAAVVNVPQQFTSLPLSSALTRAVQVSPDVAQARARVEENASLLAAARGTASPGIDVNYAAAPQGGSANNTIMQSLTTLGADVTLGDYWSFAPAVRQAQFALSGAQFDLLDAQRAERVKVIGLYFDALKAAATVDLRRQDLAGAQSDLRAAQLRYRAGDVPRLDVVRGQVALANARANIDAAQVELANAENALAVEAGVSSGDFRATQPAAIALPSAMDPQQAVTRALAQRSDLASAQQAVHGEEAAVALAQRGILPAVTVNAGYTQGMDSGVFVRGPSAAVNVRVPVSHAAADRAAAERARLAEAQYKAAALQRDITVGVSAAARTYNESVRALQSARRARTAAEQELRATQTGYRSGASSSLDVSDARRTYVQAALAELNALYAQAQAAATLQEEMGP